MTASTRMPVDRRLARPPSTHRRPLVVLIKRLISAIAASIVLAATTILTSLDLPSSTIFLTTSDHSNLPKHSALHSPACRPSFGHKTNISRIYFSHTRKAGGTTLKEFLRQVAKELHWELVSNEAQVQEFPDRNDTLYVVNIREPISRIISSYQYEGRWDCREMVNNRSTFVATYENQRTLEEGMFIIHNNFDNKTQKKSRYCGPKRLWRCVDECYTRWYGEQLNCQNNVTKNYKPALQRLLMYDIIIVTDFFKHPSYLEGLEALFGNLVQGVLQKKQKIFCSEESYRWNRLLPMSPVRKNTMALLQQWNRRDTQLFQQLVGSCPNGAHNILFPDPGEQKLTLETLRVASTNSSETFKCTSNKMKTIRHCKYQ